MHHHPQPEKIELTSDEFNKIESEIKSSNLSSKTKELILKALHFMVWLQGSLEHAKLSIKKLQKLFDIIPSQQRKKSAEKKISMQKMNIITMTKMFPLLMKILQTLQQKLKAKKAALLSQSTAMWKRS